MGLRAVVAAAAAQGFVELLDEFELVLVQVDGGFDPHPAQQVAGRSAAHGLDPLGAQPEQAARLGFRRNLEGNFAIQGRHFEIPAEAGCGEADRHFAVEVGAVAGENRVFLDADLHVQIARWPARFAGLAFAAQADAVAGIDAGRNLDRQGLGFLDPALALAGAAGVFDLLAGAAAGGAGLLHGEEALLHAYRAMALAGGAGGGRGAFLGAGSAAGLAIDVGRHANLDFGAGHGFFEGDFQVVAQVRAALHPAAAALPASAAAKDVAEHVAEDVAEAFPAEAMPAGRAHRGIDPGMPELVVGGTLLGVGKHVVGFLDLLELLFGLRVVPVAVRVVLHRQAAEALLDVAVAGVARHA